MTDNPKDKKLAHRQRIVVLVDDDADSRDILRSSISIPQIGFIEAGTAEDALRLTRDYVIDIAIVDVFMPGKGGIWLIEELRKRNPDMKIISISGGYGGMPSDTAVKAADRIGADITLTKPIDLSAFQDAVISLLD